MAMNKREQAEYEQALREVAIMRALRWSDGAEGPDVPRPENGHTEGWLYNEHAREPNVYEAWSEPTAHGTGKHLGKDRPSATQGARRLYSTRTRALKALRAALEREYAETLAKIDAQIAAETAD